MLSLTRLTAQVHPKLNKDDVKEFLIKEGYITDIKTPTAKGYTMGIEMRHKKAGVYWPVYPEEKFGKIISEAFANQIKGFDKGKKIKKRENMKYPYLGIDKFLIMDTETTGLDKKDEIIELALINQDGEKLYHEYFLPSCKIDPEAEKVHGLNFEVLCKLDAKNFKDEFDEILHHIVEADCPIIGHNIKFDTRMFFQTIKKYGFDIAFTEEDMNNDVIDTMKIAKKWMNVSSYSLNNLTNNLGVTREETHCALDDCKMTKEFLDRLEDVITVKNEYNFIKGLD